MIFHKARQGEWEPLSSCRLRLPQQTIPTLKSVIGGIFFFKILAASKGFFDGFSSITPSFNVEIFMKQTCLWDSCSWKGIPNQHSNFPACHAQLRYARKVRKLPLGVAGCLRWLSHFLVGKLWKVFFFECCTWIPWMDGWMDGDSFSHGCWPWKIFLKHKLKLGSHMS